MNAKEEIDRLTDELRLYQDKYYKEGISLISDSEYDRLTDRLMELEAAHPELAHPDSPTKRVGSDLTNDFPEVRHTIPVLSLDKAYSPDQVRDFFGKSIAKGGELLSFAAEEKIDGVSMVLYYEDGVLVRAVTRGNGEVGNDVTANIMTMRSVPLSLPEPLTIAVRGEVYIAKADFEALNAREPDEAKRAANPRNLAAGTVRRQKSSEAKLVPLRIFCYEGFWADRDQTPPDHLHILAKLKALGFTIDEDLAFFSNTEEEAARKLREAGIEGRAYAFSGLEGYIAGMAGARKGLGYEIDGLVFKINELDVRERMGYTEHHPRWAIAYKFEAPQAEAKLVGVTVQVGRTGRITPVAEITPTKLGGSTIRRATLHNQEYIDELELAIGDTVSISKRGDVIPAVERVIDKNEDGNTTFRIPDICPCCGTRLEHIGALDFCPNYGCPDQVRGRIAFFASSDQMDIESLGPKPLQGRHAGQHRGYLQDGSGCCGRPPGVRREVSGAAGEGDRGEPGQAFRHRPLLARHRGARQEECGHPHPRRVRQHRQADRGRRGRKRIPLHGPAWIRRGHGRECHQGIQRSRPAGDCRGPA